MINDMRINQPGITRLVEVNKFRIKQELDNMEEKNSYQIDKLLFMEIQD